MREYRFTGQWMFYVAAIICFFTVLFIPLGVWFIISARRARIKIDEDFFSYTMFTEKVIRFKEIKTLKLGKKVEVRYKVGYVIPTFATVVPLIVEMKNEKMIKFSLNYFESPEKLIEELQRKSRKKIIS